MPECPDDFYEFDVVLPDIRFLATLNTHVRDKRLKFCGDTHTYILDGHPTMGSVTGLVHEFSYGF